MCCRSGGWSELKISPVVLFEYFIEFHEVVRFDTKLAVADIRQKLAPLEYDKVS